MEEMDLYCAGMFKKKGLDVRQAKRMAQDKKFVRGNAWGIVQEMNT